ncbi:inactive phospholipase C-like protein 2 [Symsagittifera roscoffensis]|uniref:inactive phospholipase C-like protein 2 n=1 Tax=Symsagittifera roscoffensis TaxID=84072 RepID=UPI00307B7317
MQVLSGHFDPRDMWMCGVQYACLNMQTTDYYFIFNQAMFARNGGCGFLLKPYYLRPKNGTFFNPLTLEMRNKETLEREILKKRYLKVHILGGAHLPRKTKDNGKFCGDMVDVFVKVSLFDKIGKAKCQSFKTQIIKDNGFNPVWNEKANFIVDCPELAFVLFEVIDKDLDADDLVGINCIHFLALQNGYVTVPLHDHNYSLLPYASLFVRVSIST